LGNEETRKEELLDAIHGWLITSWPAAWLFKRLVHRFAACSSTAEWHDLTGGCAWTFGGNESDEEKATARTTMISWFVTGDATLRQRARTTCRHCWGRGHSAQLGSKTSKANKLLASANVKPWKAWERAGLLEVLKAQQPGVHK
jgi:hypothetical protein